MIGAEAAFTLLPVDRANFAVLLEMLQRVDEADRFGHRAAQRHVIDEHVPHCAFLVDEEETAIRHEFAFSGEIARRIHRVVAGQNAVALRDGLIDVGHDGVIHALDAALLARRLEPCPVRKFGVRGAADDGHIALLELSQLFLKAVQFSRADEGEIFRVKEKEDVFLPLELFEGEILDDGLSLDGLGVENGCVLTD